VKVSHGRALTNKLESALDKVDQGNIPPASAKLRAFIQQVNNFINSGQISPDVGQLLIDQTQLILDALGSSTP
jgi:hypothetical protein